MHVTYFNIVLIITSHSPPNKKRGGGGEFWVGHEHVFHLDNIFHNLGRKKYMIT